MRLVLTFLLLCNAPVAYAGPVDTLVSYVNPFGMPVEAEDAAYIRKSWKLETGWGFREYFPSGALRKSGAFANDSMTRPDGPYLEYNAEGRLLRACTYADGSLEGLSRRWHSNGQPADSEHYVHNRLDGPGVWYYPNGQKSEEGIYRDGKTTGSQFWSAVGKVDANGKPGVIPPSFPGPEDALVRFLTRKMRYPDDARERGQQGKAVIVFTVETDGRLTGIGLSRSSGVAVLDAEALRVVSVFPRWTPGFSHNRLQPMPYTLPLTFRLE
jgi:TonB family protein